MLENLERNAWQLPYPIEMGQEPHQVALGRLTDTH